MRSHYIFLLVYLLGICYGASNAQRNETCTTRETCVQVPDSTSHFLQCVGLPATDTGGDHMRRLKGMLEATMDVYTFMRSSMTGVPLLNLQGALDLRPDVDPLQNEALVQMWLEVKIKPLLKSITKQFLSCLSTKNFSCSTYQTVVRELSHHFSEMDPIRQKWIYTFFMYPFLSEDRVAGCVSPQESSEEWLIKNFGAFSAMARMKDFSTLNLVFSGLEVLHLLSPAQKAELLLRPEVAGLDNGTLSLVFHSLLTGGSGPPPTMSPPGGHNWTTPISIYHPHPPQHPFGEVVSGFMAAFRPIQSFVHDFVSFTQERDVSQIRSTTLTQFLMNWTLAELADIYRPQNASVVPETPNFDVMNVEDWYRQVVMPLLRRFLPNDDALMHQNITLAFHEVFYLDHGKDTETSVIQDVCSITLDKSPCGLTDAVQNVAHVLHCAARTNLTMSEATIMRLIEELTQRLNSLIMELSKANFRELASDFNEIFREEESTSLTKEHLQDPDFIKLWFKIKLMPLLPDIPPALLSCLSTKNFSCPVYQTIVADLSKHIFTSFMDADPMYGQNIYKNFIFSFLLQNNTSDPQCLSSANNSAEWLKNNFGFFSRFATVTEFYMLNPHFSGLEVLHLLTPKQIAEMLLLPLPTPPEKDVVINQVFDFLMESPEQLPEVLHHVVWLAREINLPCGVYKHIFERLYSAIPSLPPDFEPATWAGINELINIAPGACVPEITCPAIHFNAAKICRGIDSSDLESYFNTSGSMDVPCNFTLEKYACARLENFTAHQLVSLLKCDLPGNSSHSDVLWKMLLTKLSNVLNPALDILANMSMPMVGPSASEVLDVIGEIRVSMLTDEQLMNNREIRKWFSERLSPFLPFASGRFLQCLTHRNISCQTYQQIVQILSHLQSHMTPPRQMSVYTHFIKVFLTRNHTADPQCLSSANNSAEWLKNNFGFFSRFATVTEFYMLNPHFSGLEVLHLLTPKQIAEMLLLPLPTPPEKDVVINQVFDFLMESPEQLPEVLHHVVLLSREVEPPCGVYKQIFNRLYSAIPSLPLDFEPTIWAGIDELINIAPDACVPENITCPETLFNAAEICRGIDSSDLESYFNTSGSMDVPCNFTLEKYACARLENFTAHQLVSLLKCDLPGNSSHSKVLWKMLLTKLSNVLNPALDILANMSMPMVGPSASEVLDVIGEIRVSMLTDEQLMNNREIRKWFSERLSPFLPFASGRFLQCLTHRNISCQTYQQIVQILSHLQSHMTPPRQMSVYTHFIKVFLTRNHTADPQCLSSANNSAEWLKNNFGFFSRFATVTEFYMLNPHFSGLEVLHLLTPKQIAEMLLLPLPTPPEKDVVINQVFDFLMESPEQLPEVLHHVVLLSREVNLPCGVYKHIFERLYSAIPSLPADFEPATWAGINELINIAPAVCVPEITCPAIHFNAAEICRGIDSSDLESYFNTSGSMDVPCNFTLEKYACARLENFTAHQLVSLLKCDLPGNSSHSDVLWKMLLTKLSNVLNPALDILANMSMPMVGPSASEVLDVISEIRVSMLTDEQLMNNREIRKWFSERLSPFLPFASGRFLQCLTHRNISCQTYQQIVQILSHLQSHMTPPRQMSVYTHFIKVFLTRNHTADPQCLSSANNSAEWLKNNFGFFSRFATVTEFYMLNPHFSGLEVLHLLTPKQIAEMLLLPLPTPPEKDVVINQVFDFLMESPEQLPEVLHHVVLLSREVNLPCGVYKHIFERLYSAIPSLPADFEPATWAGINELINIAPAVCVPEITCPAIHFNAAEICRGIDSSDLESYFNTSGSMDVPCNFTLEKYACARLENFTAHQLVSLLKCDLPGNSSHSDVLWKMLLTKLSNVLNPALDILANMSMPMVGPSASEVLDVIGEIRVSMLTDEQLMNNREIRKWFSERLSPFLPFASGRFLQCLTHRNISCQTYQQIVQILSHLQSHMTPPRQMSVYTHFIKVFLTRNHTADPQCLSSANNSAEWLKNNFGFFSRFATVTEFYMLNPHFSGLEVLHLLTPKQIAEMLLLPLPTPPEKDVVINQVFDFLMESPEQLPEVLHHVVLLAREVNLPCGVYKHIFERLYSAIPSLPPDFEPATWAGINELINIAPGACAPENITCPAIHFNAAEICRGIDSSDLESYFNTSGSMDVPCNFTLEKYACARLENFTAHQLVSLLKCDLPGNSSHSDVLWKMLLTKLSNVLNPALDILANMSMPMVGPSASEVLDVISEIRVSMLTDEQLMNNREIRKWFSERLSPFLPFASGRFLQCLTHRNISCQTYQQILQVFIHQFDDMTLKQQHMVLKDFVLRFLSQPHSGPGCVNGSMGSAEWLMENLGPFSQFLTLGELLHLNPRFNPMEALRLLTPKQSAELLVLSLPNLPEKSVIINMLFDYLTEPPEHQKFSEFLSNLVPLLQRGNLSCSSYETLFARMDLAMPIVPLDIASVITYSKMALSKHLPPGCIMYSGECSVTMTNETDICVGVNSTMVQRLLDSGKMKGRFCDFAVEEFACASLSALTAEDLAAMLMCNRSSNSSGSRPVWKLLLSKASLVLNEALDLLASKTLDPQNPALPMILDSIREIRLDAFSIASLNNPAFIQQWFNSRLRPFLPAVSPDFLSCLTTKGLNCSTYQHIVKILSQLQPDMTLPRQMSVYTHFIKVFLTRNDTDPSCSLHTKNSGEWLQMNLGGFSSLVSFHDIQMLYSNFSAMEALPQLTVRQLAEVSATPGQLTSPAQVQMVMNHVPSQQLPAFFDDFSPAIMGHENMFSPPVRSAMLQVVFDRANLSDHSVSDAVVLLWLQKRLRPLLVNLSPQHVAPFFGILTGRNCSIEQQGVEDLNSTISSLNEDTKKEIYNHIIQTLRGPVPLRCYGDNYNHSFYSFMERSFMGFQFPNLTTFLSLMPHDRMHQLVNSMPPSAVGDLLRRPDVVDNDAQLCVLYNNYVQIQTFLEIESLPEVVGQPTLPCVWPMALRSSKRSEVNTWFDRSLHNYLVFLTKSLISPSITYNATCLAFQKLVSVLGEYNYTAADFVRQDVFSTIRVYLTSATVPRCYNPSDPELNSTAWFAEYIGPFIPFLTLEDLQSFGSAEVIQVFTVNPLNIALLNHSALPLNLTNYYTELVYQQDSNFNPLYLPLLFRCVAPGQAFVQLNAEESMIVLHNLTTLCTNLDPQVAAALASNFGDNIDSTAISALGKESIGISTGQLKTIKPKDLFDSLTILSTVNGWNSGQAKAIIQSLMSSGFLQINSMSSLFTLGSLIVGVPAGVFTTISGSQLISASQNPSFLTYFLTVPQVVRETYVTQIIKVNSNSETIIQNVPDEMATEIPRTMLLGFSNNNSVIKRLNKKKWKKQQVELFFDVIAVEGSTTELGGVNNLSSSVLQGFTCTTVRTVKKVQIKKLIKACRRRGNNKVLLAETQLTCMYNYIKADSDVTSFDLYPPDVLLYYDYTLVPRASCRSYFEQLADADFSVFSSALSYKRTALFNNARSCLGITNTSLTKDDIMVLGNMCCTLDGSYIENSDSSILEKLNNCPDLNDGQASAVQTLLLSGKTQYGVPSTWNEQTLQDLGMLPLYMKSAFYDNFDKKTKRRFLKFFLKVLKKNGVGRRKKRMLKREIRKSIRNKAKRSIVNECTVGTITQVTISDDTFPFDYDDINQFNCCLSAATVQENLDAITTKVDQEEYLMIVLSKLQEAYAASSTIPEDQVQLLGPASRLATVDNINTWSITQIDTLSSLMDSSNGEWDPSLARAIISKYLSVAGNKLGSTELNTIGGANLCSLDVNVLKNISQQSLKEANALTVSNCTIEKKKELFNIAEQAFSGSTRATATLSSYQLTKTYLEGASLEYIKSLVSLNVSMDMAIFTSLQENVVLNLTVNEVKDLLGTNLPELKSYENETLVQTWVRSQLQSELDTLGIGINGGRANPTTTTKSPSTTTSTSSSTSTTTAGSGSSSSTTSTTTGNGTRIRADAGLSLLAVLALLIMSQHIVV